MLIKHVGNEKLYNDDTHKMTLNLFYTSWRLWIWVG